MHAHLRQLQRRGRHPQRPRRPRRDPPGPPPQARPPLPPQKPPPPTAHPAPLTRVPPATGHTSNEGAVWIQLPGDDPVVVFEVTNRFSQRCITGAMRWHASWMWDELRYHTLAVVAITATVAAADLGHARVAREIAPAGAPPVRRRSRRCGLHNGIVLIAVLQQRQTCTSLGGDSSETAVVGLVTVLEAGLQ